MTRTTRLLILGSALLATLAVAAGAQAHGPAFGVADDAGKYADDGGAAFFGTLLDAGLTDNRITVTWDPEDGTHGPAIREKGFLDRALPVAALRGVDVVLDVYPLRARAFAVETDDRIAQFSDFLRLLARSYPTVTRFVVGNEPNQPRFNQPQFVRNGRVYQAVAGAVYERVLAAAYDALKSVNPQITVIGLGLSPRGNDDPRAKSNVSRSPVRFIADLAAAYRASGRTRPLMDELGFHPYPNSNNDPLSRGYSWPNAGVADLDRIKQAVWDGFAGTGQSVFAEDGQSTGLAFQLDEYGRQVAVVGSAASAYTGRENVRTISEARQAGIYSAVVRQVECDPAVAGFFFFHLVDESDLDRFQSGLVRADGTKRPAYAAVKQTLAETKGQCGGALRSWRHTSSVVGADVTFDAGSLSVGAAEDVTATTGVFPASTRPGQIMDALSGRHVARSTTSRAVRAYHDSRISLEAGSAGGSYVEAVVLRAVANPGRTFFAVSDPIG